MNVIDQAKNAEAFIEDRTHEQHLDKLLWMMRTRRDEAASRVPEWEKLRDLASQIKEHTLSNLAHYLEMFESRAKANGVTVHWAQDAAEHNQIVYQILSDRKVDALIKSKSMLTEECDTRRFLENRGIRVSETDLGERIQQLDDEPPSHIVAPAWHKTAQDIANLFARVYGSDKDKTDPVYLAHVMRENTRPLIEQAKAGMTGANFAVAETGAIVTVTNEGNADLSAHTPELRICSVGLEKIIPKTEHLAVFIRLLTRSATGNAITQYTSHFRAPRQNGEMHIILVDNGRSSRLFVDAVQELYPRCCIHFEDWKGTDAIRLLARYIDKVSCYNDDIQGTGSVTVAGLYSALKLTRGELKDQRILFFGAGSAGIGIANMIVSAMKLEGASEKDARQQISLFDVNGLLEPSRTDLSPDQRVYAHPHSPSRSLVEVIRSLKPTVLIGVSTVGKTFTKEVVKAMTELNARPIIFALSNPTEHAECTAEEAYSWSNGKAIYAAGVQFDPVKLGDKTYLPGQANNFYIFPGVGLAVYATEAKRVPDELFIEAAKATADQVGEKERKQGMLFPPQNDILKIEVQTAIRVAEKIFDLGLARVKRPNDIPAWIKGLLYKPEYRADQSVQHAGHLSPALRLQTR